MLQQRHILLSFLLLTVSIVSAQLHESVSVDGTYLKDILHPDRINQLPRLTLMPLGDTQLEYATRGVNAYFMPSATIIGATDWGAQRESSPGIGYLDLSMGSYLDAALYFGAGILRQPDQTLDLRMQHNSTSLWKPYGDMADFRVSYAENIGLTYARRFADAGSLSVSGQYHLGYFNYYGVNPELVEPDPSATGKFHLPTQTLNDAAVKIDWHSLPASADGLAWNAMAAVRYFGYRTATRETDLNLRGGLIKNLDLAGSFGLDASLHTLIYGSAEGVTSPDNYTSLTLTPYYKWGRNAVSFHIGADLDLTFNADGNLPDKHFSAIHAAPDVRFDISTKNAGFYIHLLGGTELHTLAALSQIDPYRNPMLESTEPMYTPLDANLGVELNPGAGFTAALNLQYKVTSFVPMDGWHMALLNYGDNVMPGLSVPAGLIPAYGRDMERYNLSGFSACLHLGYKPSEVFEIHADGQYTPQHDKKGVFNGLDRPRWIAGAGFTLRPVRKLSIGAEAEYRGVRRIYTGYYDPDAPQLLPGGADPAQAKNPKMQVASMALPDLCMLSAHVTWDITPRFAIRCEASNLLNRRDVILPETPIQGISFKGGLQWLF